MSLPQNSNHKLVTHLEVYKQAVSLFTTSRLLATYITDNKTIAVMNQSGDMDDTYSLQMVMDSMSLVPDITEAYTTFDLSLKKYRIRRMRRTLVRIHRYCDYLEKRYEHAKDYIMLLREEIAAYRKAHSTWENHVLNKN